MKAGGRLMSLVNPVNSTGWLSEWSVRLSRVRVEQVGAHG
jgi:hypothetical protein